MNQQDDNGINVFRKLSILWDLWQSESLTGEFSIVDNLLKTCSTNNFVQMDDVLLEEQRING